MSTENLHQTPPSGGDYDVVGIGNAIVDVLSHVEEEFLEQNALAKGSMQLVDEARAKALYDQIGPTKECSGGSVANTLAGMASLGAKTAFIGKVASDQLGTIFTHDMKSVGVHFPSIPATGGPATASCLVCVTPDAQRTMMTFIGACNRVSEADVDEDLIKNAAVLYIEGYLWDVDQAKTAIRKAITLAKKHGKKVALTLSDTFCVDRFRQEFLSLISSDVDILFANEAELQALFQMRDSDKAARMLQGVCEVALITRSEHGAVLVTREKMEAVAALPVKQLVDTTGAGDLFASGFLYGYTRGWSHAKSVALGNRAAGQIIQQLGARSMEPLTDLLAA
ncbi:MAG: adenosine kinase [Alphaproteobacteria bacterium]|nr:adenosine kinase [Alphaproteobacteria bacterium]